MRAYLRQTLEAFLIDHRPALQAAVVGTAMALTPLTAIDQLAERIQASRAPTP